MVCGRRITQKKMSTTDIKTAVGNPNEIDVTLLDVTPQGHGVFSKSANKTFWFARAEIPAIPGTGAVYSTVRLQCVRNEPFPPHWQRGAKVRAVISDMRTKDGEGSLDVPKA